MAPCFPTPDTLPGLADRAIASDAQGPTRSRSRAAPTTAMATRHWPGATSALSGPFTNPLISIRDRVVLNAWSAPTRPPEKKRETQLDGPLREGQARPCR